MIENALTIPRDIEAEQAVIGAIIVDNSFMADVVEVLSPNEFFEENHRHIYKAMVELYKRKSPIDEILVGDELKSFGKLEEIGGYAYLAELSIAAPSTGNIVYYAKIIKESSQLRDLIETTSNIARKSRDPQASITDLLIEAETKIREIALSSGNTEYEHIKDVILKEIPRIEQASEAKNDIIGIKSGITDLDKMLCGFQPKLYIIGARPSIGKSSLATNIAEYAALDKTQKGAVYICSLEMENSELCQRIISSNARIDSRKLKTGSLKTQEEWDRLANSFDRLMSTDIYLNDATYDIDKICYSATNLHRKVGLKMFIFDYLQLGGKKTMDKNQNRERFIAEMSRELKLLSKELGIPVIALSQLNRSLELRSDKRPQLSDLRESGSIEQDSDVIIFIYRDKFYNEFSEYSDIAEFIIAKNRGGPTGTIPTRWIPNFTKFTNLDDHEKHRFFNLAKK